MISDRQVEQAIANLLRATGVFWPRWSCCLVEFCISFITALRLSIIITSAANPRIFDTPHW